MVLGFMTCFPWGEPTNFRLKIAQGEKIHTIREGQRRKAGARLHMATGVRTENYFQINKNLPDCQFLKSVQRFDLIQRSENCALIFVDKKLKFSVSESQGQTKFFGLDWFEQFLKNDGLTASQFWTFFNKDIRNGQILHWTDLKY